ncbi:MAG: non-ribosomal peptide synthetase, partial [Microcoleus sp. SIO2G3]|nr:non-ribosomal peptide synthetase [Microcoleus sp. SIO2G3]
GGMVALEVAQQLQAQGETIALLALFDTPAPGAFALKPWRQRLYGHFDNLSRFGLSYVRKKIASKLHRTTFWLSQWGERQDQPQPYEFVRENYERLMAGYQPQRYAGAVTLFLATDRSAIADTVCDPALMEIDPLFGWGKLAQSVEVYDIAGDHLGILKEPQVKQLALQLQTCIDRVEARV